MPIFTSHHDNQNDPIERSRQLLATANSERKRLVQELAEKRQKRDALAAAHGKDDKRTLAAQGAYQETLAVLVAARQTIREAQTALDAKLVEFLGDAPAADIGRLSGDLPIVMMPVRLETRFVRGHHDSRYAGVLRLRIYPDAISAVSHEPLLSADEIEAGRDYWKLAWQKADERDAWSALLKETSPARAAWIVEQTGPTNMEQFPQQPESENDHGRVQPQFADLPTRPRNWRGTSEARLLPDRWLVRTYRHYPAGSAQDVREVFSKPVRESLALTLSLSQDGSEAELDDRVPLSNDGLKIDPEILWTFDFERALDVGMAVSLDLTPRELEAGFARIIVVGIKSSLSADQSAARLGSLIDSHHYSRGFSFVAQGTPTNNTKEASAAYPASDPNGAMSFSVERDPGRKIAERDGGRVATALGISADHLRCIEGAERDEQSAARAMAEALWPATLGYFLEQLMSPYIDSETIEQTRAYFVRYVRGRGFCPAFRVGEVPYGLLPVTSLTKWQPDNAMSGLERRLPGLLNNMRSLWLSAAQSAPHLGQSNDPDKDLLTVLGLDASAREVFVRTCLGSQTLEYTGELIETATTYNDSPQVKAAEKLASLLGIDTEWVPRVALLGYGNEAQKFRYGFVVTDPSAPLSESQGLKFDYINWLRNADPERLRDETLPAGVEKPYALLYLMLRHATLTEYSRQARNLLIRLKLVDDDERIEREFVNIMPDSSTDSADPGKDASAGAVAKQQVKYAPTIWERFRMPVQGVTKGQPLGKYLASERTEAQGPEDERLRAYRAALAGLEGLPTAELERLFSETLDVCSHRFDAWATSIASQRLERLRTRKPQGCHLGGYGWLEEVRADPPAQVKQQKLDEKRSVTARRDDGGGFIHAPSMNQAVAAAVLRNGFLTRSGQSREPYAVNLNSARVRKALWFLDAVREGQPIGAALGYQFERGLHERHPGLELDKFIDDFRNHFPLVANKTSQSGLPAESVSARHVVDGRSLREAWRNSVQGRVNGIPWNALVPQPSQAERVAIETELRELDDIVDAMSDLLLAESVYQIVIGNSSGAGASLDTLAKGVRPPDPQIVRTPRGGTDITHRVSVVLGGEPSAAPPWLSVAQRTPRALAEPILNAWVGELLGDPAKVLCQASFEIAATGADTLREVSLAMLQIEPLDVLAMARTLEDSVASEFARAAIAESELGRRILAAGLGQDMAGGPIQIIFDVPGMASDERGFPELLEVARAINATLGSARALRPADVLPPSQASMASSAGLLLAELTGRATLALESVKSARDRLLAALAAANAAPASDVPTLGNLRVALQQAANCGAISAYPPPRPDDLSRERLMLTELGESVARDLSSRYEQALAEPNPVVCLQHIFGKQFLVLPRFVPPDISATGVSLDQVLGNGPGLGPRPQQTVTHWLMQAARVRKPLRQWRQLALYAGTRDQDLTSFAVAQFPYVNGADWVGLAFGSEDKRPAAGSTSILMHRHAQPGATQAWAGLLLDEWQEKVPSRQEDTAVAFHYDSPDAEAPQAVLLAVHPLAVSDEKTLASLRWDMESLMDMLNETLDMAKMRAVTGEQLADLSQALPMTYLASNPANETVSTSFAGILMMPMLLLAAES